ncbi:toxin glutamine deamidase domain-containing protein [Actinoallomurus purpureus]|uniref:toxin glutamine deamidase domain-containing protein n=1 Tax=Actinoallomurus purpureus TaxID=478114 RepID=UPI0020925ADF|nr:toxin glutamine deamidase domain-containing protein [Actinoallomurus purpureus]MCO6006292.1 toxin glutamine deamidase domain-containing protein [Actinoallomurus purpureus]
MIDGVFIPYLPATPTVSSHTLTPAPPVTTAHDERAASEPDLQDTPADLRTALDDWLIWSSKLGVDIPAAGTQDLSNILSRAVESQSLDEVAEVDTTGLSMDHVHREFSDLRLDGTGDEIRKALKNSRSGSYDIRMLAFLEQRSRADHGRSLLDVMPDIAVNWRIARVIANRNARSAPAHVRDGHRRLPDDVVESSYPWLPEVNPFHSWGGDFFTNCVLAAIGTDLTLEEAMLEPGEDSALRRYNYYSVSPSEIAPREYIENMGKGESVAVPGYAAIVDAMTEAGRGARGIVIVDRHVYNVVHDKNGVVFLDGQKGRQAILPAWFQRLEFLPTSDDFPRESIAVNPNPGPPSPFLGAYGFELETAILVHGLPPGVEGTSGFVLAANKRLGYQAKIDGRPFYRDTEGKYYLTRSHFEQSGKEQGELVRGSIVEFVSTPFGATGQPDDARADDRATVMASIREKLEVLWETVTEHPDHRPQLPALELFPEEEGWELFPTLKDFEVDEGWAGAGAATLEILPITAPGSDAPVLYPQYTAGVPLTEMHDFLKYALTKTDAIPQLVEIVSGGLDFGDELAQRFVEWRFGATVPRTSLDKLAEIESVSAIRSMAALVFPHIAARMMTYLYPGALSKNFLVVASRVAFAGMRRQLSDDAKTFLEQNAQLVRDSLVNQVRRAFPDFDRDFYEKATTYRGTYRRFYAFAKRLPDGRIDLLRLPIQEDEDGKTIGDYLDNALLDRPNQWLDQDDALGIFTQFDEADTNKNQLTVPLIPVELRTAIPYPADIHDVEETLTSIDDELGPMYDRAQRKRGGIDQTRIDALLIVDGWETQSKLSPRYPRSKELQQIDKRLAAWRDHGRYLSGRFDLKQQQLEQILSAIDQWSTSKQGRPSKRAAVVDRLRRGIEIELSAVATQRDAGLRGTPPASSQPAGRPHDEDEGSTSRPDLQDTHTDLPEEFRDWLIWSSEYGADAPALGTGQRPDGDVDVPSPRTSRRPTPAASADLVDTSESGDGISPSASSTSAAATSSAGAVAPADVPSRTAPLSDQDLSEILSRVVQSKSFDALAEVDTSGLSMADVHREFPDLHLGGTGDQILNALKNSSGSYDIRMLAFLEQQSREYHGRSLQDVVPGIVVNWRMANRIANRRAAPVRIAASETNTSAEHDTGRHGAAGTGQSPDGDVDVPSPSAQRGDATSDVLRLRGGAGEFDGDIIDDWETLSRLPFHQSPTQGRSPALKEVDRALRQWKDHGRLAPEELEQNARELRAILDAIEWWRAESSHSNRRIAAINQLQQRVQHELDNVIPPPAEGKPMPVASHPADDDDEDERQGLLAREATQQMVPGARDLQIARWLLADDQVKATVGARKDIEDLRKKISLYPRDSPVAERLQRHAERLEEDFKIFFSIWKRFRQEVSVRDEAPSQRRRLREAQAAALVVVERRGRDVSNRDRAAANSRLERAEWAQRYSHLNIDRLLRAAHEHLRSKMLLTTNMPVRKIDDLLADSTGKFRNYWETGTTNGDDKPTKRRKIEEIFGYAATLGRSRGLPGPERDELGDLPKYAALMSRLRPHGLQDYGSAVFVWKQEVRARATFTPEDSFEWEVSDVRGARSVTGPDHLYPLLAYGQPKAVRLALAEATGFAYDPELRGELNAGVDMRDYFEAQIHGDLQWQDLEKVVIVYYGGGRDEAERYSQRLEKYARDKKLDFGVELSPLGSTEQPASGSTNDFSSPKRGDVPSQPLRLRGGAGEFDGDIIDDWETLSRLPFLQSPTRGRSPALKEVDLALDLWKNGGLRDTDGFHRSERGLQNILAAIDRWLDSKDRPSNRSAAIYRLQGRVIQELAKAADQRHQAAEIEPMPPQPVVVLNEDDPHAQEQISPSTSSSNATATSPAGAVPPTDVPPRAALLSGQDLSGVRPGRQPLSPAQVKDLVRRLRARVSEGGRVTESVDEVRDRPEALSGIISAWSAEPVGFQQLMGVNFPDVAALADDVAERVSDGRTDAFEPMSGIEHDTLSLLTLADVYRIRHGRDVFTDVPALADAVRRVMDRREPDARPLNVPADASYDIAQLERALSGIQDRQGAVVEFAITVRPLAGMSDQGHVWVSVRLPLGTPGRGAARYRGRVFTMGFGAANAADVPWFGSSAGAVFSPDFQSVPRIEAPKQVTVEQMQSGVDFARSKQNQPYQWLLNNCVTFAAEMHSAVLGDLGPFRYRSEKVPLPIPGNRVAPPAPAVMDFEPDHVAEVRFNGVRTDVPSLAGQYAEALIRDLRAGRPAPALRISAGPGTAANWATPQHRIAKVVRDVFLDKVRSKLADFDLPAAAQIVGTQVPVDIRADPSIGRGRVRIEARITAPDTNTPIEHDTGRHGFADPAPGRVRPDAPSGHRSDQHAGDPTAAGEPAVGSRPDPQNAADGLPPEFADWQIWAEWAESSYSTLDENGEKACVSIAVVGLRPGRADDGPGYPSGHRELKSLLADGLGGDRVSALEREEGFW